MFVDLVGRLLRLIGTILLLLDYLAPLLQFVVATGASFLQALLQRLNLGVKTLGLLRMVLVVW